MATKENRHPIIRHPRTIILLDPHACGVRGGPTTGTTILLRCRVLLLTSELYYESRFEKCATNNNKCYTLRMKANTDHNKNPNNRITSKAIRPEGEQNYEAEFIVSLAIMLATGER